MVLVLLWFGIVWLFMSRVLFSLSDVSVFSGFDFLRLWEDL